MATSVMQIRIDDELKAKASAVFEQLGIDVPTAVRIFLKRAVLENGIPFSMTIPKENKGLTAIRLLQESAVKNGLSDMTLEEINEEIMAAREEMMRKGENV